MSGSETVATRLAEAIELHERVKRAGADAVLAAADTLVAALTQGGKVLVFGNGGSAAEAQHVAAELVGRFQRDRRALAAIALTTDSSVLTSVANDLAFDQVFARQIEALGRPGDVALAISTSGESANVVKAVHVAQARGLKTIGLTGHDGGALGRGVEVHVNVPSRTTARVQEVQLTLLHIICELVEDACVAGGR